MKPSTRSRASRSLVAVGVALSLVAFGAVGLESPSSTASADVITRRNRSFRNIVPLLFRASGVPPARLFTSPDSSISTGLAFGGKVNSEVRHISNDC